MLLASQGIVNASINGLLQKIPCKHLHFLRILAKLLREKRKTNNRFNHETPISALE
jgi:hypothetical protein